MKELHANYMRIAGRILQYIDRIISTVIKENKNVIVYAADKSGQYIRHLVEDYDGRIQIHCYIDNEFVNLDTNIPIYRQSYFDYIDNDKYIVLSGVRDIDFIVSSLKEYGYALDKNLFDVRGNIGNSYVE